MRRLVLSLAVLASLVCGSYAAFVQFAVNGGAAPVPVCVDAVPSVATTFGFTTCTFSVDFTSSITAVDINNTGGATNSYQFWVQSSYSNGCVTPSTDYTNTNGALKIATNCTPYPGQAPNLTTVYLPAWTIASATWSSGTATIETSISNTLITGDQVYINNTSPSGYQTTGNGQPCDGSAYTITVVDSQHFTYALAGNPFGTSTTGAVYKGFCGWRGRLFANGFVRRVTFAFDETLYSANITFNSFWAQSLYGETGGENFEGDWFDFLPGSGTVELISIIHDWQANNMSSYTPQSRASIGNPVLDGTHFYSVDQVWVPTSKNGGTGVFQTWFYNPDNSTYYHMTNYDQTYTLTTGATPAASPSNPNGVYSIVETGAPGLPIQITSGTFPLYIKNIQVWQTQLSDVVVK